MFIVRLRRLRKRASSKVVLFIFLNIYSIHVDKSAQTQTQVADVAQDTVSGLMAVSIYYTLFVTYVSPYNNILIYNIFYLLLLYMLFRSHLLPKSD